MIFSELDERSGALCHNDLFVAERRGNGKGERPEVKAAGISALLLEAVAFRRSQLFGLALADRFVNVMLPHAILHPRMNTMACAGGGREKTGAFALQPLVTLLRDASDRTQFRRAYTLSLFLVPIEGSGWRARAMSTCEIEATLNAGWSLADVPLPDALTPFSLCGPLLDYLPHLAEPFVGEMLFGGNESAPPQTLRQTTEIIAFAVAMRLARGSTGSLKREVQNRIGNEVVTALGTARVSAAVLIDPELREADVADSDPDRDLPGSLGALMTACSYGTRPPSTPWPRKVKRKHRLDRPFVDSSDYAVGMLPRTRCLIVTNTGTGTDKPKEKLLNRVGAVAYMAIGGATAIGTLREIDCGLEGLEGASPRKIAAIDGEIATDLHEIYDLDITRETYRHLYARLRDRLGITADYKTLQKKMDALYRTNMTIYSDRAERLLIWLTGAIVILTLFVLVKP